MNLIKNCVRDLSLLVFFATICSAGEADNGFLNVKCTEAKDCYVLDDVYQGLWLTCWQNVQKCKCQNIFRSDFHLVWENGECLMSKYGPCGAKGELAVGCRDDFVCVENQCRDPKDTSPRSVKVTPFVFTESKCSEGCSVDHLILRCKNETDHCECAKDYTVYNGDTYWDIRNYDGNKNCSIGKFGPCGSKNGITIDCHGDGVSCINGSCLNPNHFTSDVGEECDSKEYCKEGLLCSQSFACIQPFSLPKNIICADHEECQKGLQCKRPRGSSWGSAFCTGPTSENE